MKKYFFIGLLVMTFFSGSSQTNDQPEPRHFTKAQLSEITNIQQLADLPKELVAFSSDFTGKCAGIQVSVDNSGKLDKEDGRLDNETIQLLKCVDAGTKLYVDIKYRALGSQMVRTLTFAIRVNS